MRSDFSLKKKKNYLPIPASETVLLVNASKPLLLREIGMIDRKHLVGNIVSSNHTRAPHAEFMGSSMIIGA